MKKERGELTVQRVKEYKTLGVLTDYIYFILNGTYIGTYHRSPPLLDPKPEIQLDVDWVRSHYSQLSKSLKETFKDRLLQAIETCGRENWDKEFTILTQLTQELYLGTS